MQQSGKHSPWKKKILICKKSWYKEMDLVTTPSVKLAEDLTIYLCLVFKNEIIFASCQTLENQGFTSRLLLSLYAQICAVVQFHDTVSLLQESLWGSIISDLNFFSPEKTCETPPPLLAIGQPALCLERLGASWYKRLRAGALAGTCHCWSQYAGVGCIVWVHLLSPQDKHVLFGKIPKPTSVLPNTAPNTADFQAGVQCFFFNS